MTEYPPHPLVTLLAQGLGKTVDELAPAAEGFKTAQEGRAGDAAMAEAAQELADALARQPDLPALMNFAGFLGGVIDDEDGVTQTRWQVLYLDVKLQSWLLVKEDDILLRLEVGHEEAERYEKRDVIWLKTDASLSQGSGPIQPDELQARLLRGDFTRAAEVAASLTDGPVSAPTGAFCAPTPQCCGRPTRLTRSC